MTKGEKKKLYELLRKIVVLRDGESCLRCGKQGVLHLSHIYPKGRYRKMEFEPLNLKFLCVGCHLFWWHKNPIEAQEWLKTALTPNRLKRLKLMSNTDTGKFDPKLHKIFLEEELKRYGAPQK